MTRGTAPGSSFLNDNAGLFRVDDLKGMNSISLRRRQFWLSTSNFPARDEKSNLITALCQLFWRTGECLPPIFSTYISVQVFFILLELRL